jgi:hypothetical protein
MVSSISSVLVVEASGGVHDILDVCNNRGFQSGLVSTSVLRLFRAFARLFVVTTINLIDQAFVLGQVGDNATIKELEKPLRHWQEALDNSVIHADGILGREEAHKAEKFHDMSNFDRLEIAAQPVVEEKLHGGRPDGRPLHDNILGLQPSESFASAGELPHVGVVAPLLGEETLNNFQTKLTFFFLFFGAVVVLQRCARVVVGGLVVRKADAIFVVRGDKSVAQISVVVEETSIDGLGRSRLRLYLHACPDCFYLVFVVKMRIAAFP